MDTTDGLRLQARIDPSGNLEVTDQDGRKVERVTGVQFRQVWNQHTPMSNGESHGMGFLTLEVIVKKPQE